MTDLSSPSQHPEGSRDQGYVDTQIAQTEIAVVLSADLTEAQRTAKQCLQASCFSAVPVEELMEDFVAESFATVLAHRAGELVGCVSVFKRPIVYEGRPLLLGGFGGTCTRADVRRQGIGTRVCRAAYQRLWEEECELAFLAAAPGTERFYGQFGFTSLGWPYTFVNAYGHVKQPPEADDGMIAPIRSQVAFEHVRRGTTPLHLGPEKGYW